MEGQPMSEIPPIDVDALHRDNRGWAKKYVAGLQERLVREAAAEPPDADMVAYLERELVTYGELLGRCGA